MEQNLRHYIWQSNNFKIKRAAWHFMVFIESASTDAICVTEHLENRKRMHKIFDQKKEKEKGGKVYKHTNKQISRYLQKKKTKQNCQLYSFPLLEIEI